ncbi:DUF6542 domain-containing protein [Streptomyces gobiensis]|uniref:DUF6542 domain-containing protein n=1 Tax=Streptomyces gobiensis TaxID=2875706 RepID=UPI001E44FE40|nr:DUF6542 domain-containing protein [Streptomyces gobiensis]UGY93436.1 hypothetical protein test1122_18065 [Streptomyces gobiensis]
MEQHSAPISQPSRRRPAPPQATLPRPTRQPRSRARPLARETAGGYRARQPARPTRSRSASMPPRLPRPRLTALGSGLLAVLLMMVFGGLDALLLGGSPAPYGCCFVLVSIATALWVRPADLLTAPIAAPIAFTTGLIFISDGSGSFGSRAMGLITALAMNAGWIYGGTVASLLTALVRKVLLVARRRAARRQGSAAA